MSGPPASSEDVPRVDACHVARSEPSQGGGTLVLLGGAVTPTGHALGAFLDLTRARDGGRVIGFTVASATPDESATYWRTVFQSAGATNVHIPPFDRRDPVLDAEVAAQVDAADGVFLGGGDQVTLVAALSGTRAEAAIKALHHRGGTVGGTSAGAAALTELTMAGGEIDLEGNLVAQYIGPGLGLLGFDAIVDTHFSQRRRLQRLFFVIAANTQLFGLGIDEDTALVVRDGLGHVIGAGGVTFVDGRDTVRFDNARDLETGRQLTLSHLRVGIVGTRYHLDLRARELGELLADAPSPHRRQPQD